MNIQEAIAEVKQMKTTSPSEYLATVNKPMPKVQDSGLPVQLSEAHAVIESQKITLAESNLKTAKMAVALSVDRDDSRIKLLLTEGKLTVPMANKAIAFCEAKRADQILKLAEGDDYGAQGSDQDVNSILEMLGELPKSVATDTPADGGNADTGSNPVDPAAPGTNPVVQPDPTGLDSGPDDGAQNKLDAKAQEIMQREGCPYKDALIKAQDELVSGASPKGGAGVPPALAGVTN